MSGFESNRRVIEMLLESEVGKLFPRLRTSACNLILQTGCGSWHQESLVDLPTSVLFHYMVEVSKLGPIHSAQKGPKA